MILLMKQNQKMCTTEAPAARINPRPNPLLPETGHAPEHMRTCCDLGARYANLDWL